MKSRNLTVRLTLDLYGKIEGYANAHKLSKGLVIKKALEVFQFADRPEKNNLEALRKELDEKHSHLLNRLNILGKELSFIRNEISHGKRA